MSNNCWSAANFIRGNHKRVAICGFVVELVTKGAASASATEIGRSGTASTSVHVSLVGVASHPAQIQPGEWLIKEIRLTSSIAYLHEDFEIAKDLVATGRINVSRLHTSTSSLTDLGGAFDKLADNPREVKILVDPRL